MAISHMQEASTVATVDLERLLNEDEAEAAKMIEALEYPGYFYIDFREARPTQHMGDDALLMYKLAQDYFQEPSEVKQKHRLPDLPSWSDKGYKSCETDESFEISQDELRNGQLQLPRSMNQQIGVIARFYEMCDVAARAMLHQLQAGLGLELLEELHRPTEPSETGLKLISEPAIPFAAQVIENKHRDSGTLTMLFYDSWSLQVCLSQDGDLDGRQEGDGVPSQEQDQDQEWAFVPPPPVGCALVHGASSLARLSKGRLRAPLHRVTQPDDGAQERYFLSHFLRPAHRVREAWANGELVGGV